MSLISLQKAAYAETHFKFRLPWSLLYRKHPEILIDAPFQVQGNLAPEIWIVARDADRFPCDFFDLKLSISKEGEESFDVSIDQKLHLSKNFEFHSLWLPQLKPGHYKINASFKTSIQKKIKTWKRWTYPFLKATPLQIHVLQDKYFVPKGFAAGEMHCHTHYTSSHVEFGAPPWVLQRVASQVGLDFVLCTDHSYDLAFDAKDYTLETKPDERFAALKKEVEHLDKEPLMLVGEEVSVGSHQNKNLHLCVLRPKEYIPGIGDSGRYFFKNKPSLSIPEALQIINGPCFAAHPLQKMSFLERIVFNRGYWDSKDLCAQAQNPVRGIQFWNGSLDKGFKKGKAWWVSLLEKGVRVLPIGGNDAHGDFNNTVGIQLPLISLKQSQKHLFGKVKTVIPVDGDLNENAIVKSFEKDRLYLTNGPALWWTRTEYGLVFEAQSNADFGKISAFLIFAKKNTHSKETLILKLKNLSYYESQSLSFQDYAYLRAELHTQNAYALTSAAFADFKNES